MLKQEMLYELDELLDIMQFERVIHHKIEELKIYLRDEIDYYRGLKGYFKKLAYSEIKLVEETVDGDEYNPDHFYYFQLRREKDGRWGVYNFEPTPPPEYKIDDFVPQEIINYILTEVRMPGKIESITDLSFPRLKRYRCDLNYSKYSDYIILGAIQVKHFEKKDDSRKEGEIPPYRNHDSNLVIDVPTIIGTPFF